MERVNEMIKNTIVEIEDEIKDEYSNDDLFNISSWGADLSFRELITMYEEGELVKPELQRKYVWERNEASRFIESILLGLPVPSIFLAQVGKKKLIVDGYQRIMTVYEYIKLGIFSKDGKVFKLSSSDMINPRWRGKSFNELEDDDKITLRSTTIHAIVFEQKKPNNDTSLYQIFERINTSGRTLKPQEIRNCIYQGTFNTLLFKLNKNKNWRKLYGDITEDTRMIDIEFILRFFAISHLKYDELKIKQISLKKYLNEFMGEYKDIDENDSKIIDDDFTNCMDFIFKNIGLDAFHSISPSSDEYVQRFHPTIFDAVTIATYIYLKSANKAPVNLIKEKHFDLVNDEEFKEYISIRTTNIDNIKGRIGKALQYLYEMEVIL